MSDVAGDAEQSIEASMILGSCHCGAVGWQFDGVPESATACSCTVCRRYGVLWAYDYEGERIRVSGTTAMYAPRDSIGFHFCGTCGCIVYWRALSPRPDGRRRIAVNLRMAEPAPVAGIPVQHCDGIDTFDNLPSKGRCVADYWF